MRDFYSKARSVIAWIGEKVRSPADAVAFLEAEAREARGKEQLEDKFRRSTYPKSLGPH